MQVVRGLLVHKVVLSLALMIMEIPQSLTLVEKMNGMLIIISYMNAYIIAILVCRYVVSYLSI